MAEAKNYTQAGFDALQKELDYLRDVRRVEVKEKAAKYSRTCGNEIFIYYTFAVSREQLDALGQQMPA